MYRSDPDFTETDIAALWPGLFGDMSGSSNMSAPRVIHEASTTSCLSSADTGFISINAGNESVLTSTPTVPMGTFTTQLNHLCPVSKQ